MLLDLCFLDYVWRGLSISVVLLTVLQMVMAVVPRLARGSSARAGKWFLNLHYLSLAGVFISGFFYVAAFDRDLAVGCFRDFVKNNGSFTLTRIVAEAWLVVAATLLIGDGLRIALSTLRGFGLRACLDPMALRLLADLKLKMRIRSDVGLFHSQASVGPHVYGLFNPRIVVPFDLLVEGELLRGIVAHELAHVRDRDALWSYFELILRRLLFFHPLVYLLARDHRECIERAADEQAVMLGEVEAGTLVRSLLHVAGRYWLQPARFELAASRGFQEIKIRIEALARLTAIRRSRNMVFVLATLVSFSAGWAEARGTVAAVTELREEVRMCRQVADEQQLRAWLNMQVPSNRCEKP